MEKEIFKMCAIQCKKVYESNIDLGTTEFNLGIYFKGPEAKFQILSIAGTNELKDWGKNLNLWSEKGIKKSSFDAAQQIMASRQFHDNRDINLPLIVTGHSKAGATAISFHKLYSKRAIGSSHCVAFAPARCLRYWTSRKMNNTYLFIDPDDPVSFVGRFSFGHPKCKTFESSNNYFGFKVSDHYINNWIEYCQGM